VPSGGGTSACPDGSFLNATGIHNGVANYLFADGHVKSLIGSRVSAGYNATTPSTAATLENTSSFTASGTQVGNDPYCGNSMCGGTFSAI
jgi:prepilin-type processing-associated H-X9-DG protein